MTIRGVRGLHSGVQSLRVSGTMVDGPHILSEDLGPSPHTALSDLGRSRVTLAVSLLPRPLNCAQRVCGSAVHKQAPQCLAWNSRVMGEHQAPRH